MMTRFFTLVFLIVSTSVFGQVPLLHEYTPHSTLNKMVPFELDNKLYQVGSPSGFSYTYAGGSIDIVSFDTLLNEVNSMRTEGTDFILDSLDNIITFYGANHGGDYIRPELTLTFSLYDTDLEFKDYYNTYEYINNYNGTNDKIATGKIVQVDNEHVLIFLSDHRIIYNIYSHEFISHLEDVPLGVLEKVDIVDNNKILIQEYQSEVYYLADSTGIVYDTLNMNISRDWEWYEGFLWMTTDNKIIQRNNLFEIVETYEYPVTLNQFQLGLQGELLISGGSIVIEIKGTDLEPEIIFESNHPGESISSAFYFNNQLFLQGVEHKFTPGTGKSTTRLAKEIDFEKLPNIGVEIIDYSIDIYPPMSFGDLGLRFEVEIENKGDHTLKSIYYITDGDCTEHIWRPNYCSRNRLTKLNILPGETKTVTIYSQSWDAQINDPYEVYIIFYNPNKQYDSDMSDNSIWTNVIYNDIKNINPKTSTNLYPNPVSDQLNLELDSSQNYSSIEIFNEMGQQVKSVTIKNNDWNPRLDVSDLVPGMYSILLHGKNESARSKFIKI